VPTLVLSGSKDKNAPAPMMAKDGQLYSVRTVHRTGRVSGHLVNLERPNAFQRHTGRLSKKPTWLQYERRP